MPRHSSLARNISRNNIRIGVVAGERRFESLLSLRYNDKGLILGGEQEPEQLAEIKFFTWRLHYCQPRTSSSRSSPHLQMLTPCPTHKAPDLQFLTPPKEASSPRWSQNVGAFCWRLPSSNADFQDSCLHQMRLKVNWTVTYIKGA
eukprot:Gb_05617 [translate_table: standard]